MSDLIQLNLNLDRKRKEIIAWGKTGCSQWYSRNADRIVPRKYWTYIDYPQDFISFNDETEVIFLGGQLWLMTQKTTVINPVKIDGV